MSAKDDGGAAFPELGNVGYKSEWQSESGITKRDYFAAKAMHAHLITDTVPGPACDALVAAATAANQDPLYRICLNAYEVADNMLKARSV